jgi:hypothetical protein
MIFDILQTNLQFLCVVIALNPLRRNGFRVLSLATYLQFLIAQA